RERRHVRRRGCEAGGGSCDARLFEEWGTWTRLRRRDREPEVLKFITLGSDDDAPPLPLPLPVGNGGFLRARGGRVSRPPRRPAASTGAAGGRGAGAPGARAARRRPDGESATDRPDGAG